MWKTRQVSDEPRRTRERHVLGEGRRRCFYFISTTSSADNGDDDENDFISTTSSADNGDDNENDGPRRQKEGEDDKK